MTGKCGGKHMFARVAPTWPIRDLRPDTQGGHCCARRSSTTPYSTATTTNSGPTGRRVAATVITGVLTEVTPRAIVVSRPDGEQFLALSPSTVTWLGAKTSPSALRAGDPVIVRRRTHRLISGPRPDGGPASGGPAASIAERIWARIGRVAGAIIEVRRIGAAGRYRAARPRARARRHRRGIAAPHPGPLSPAHARLPDRRDRHPPRPTATCWRSRPPPPSRPTSPPIRPLPRRPARTAAVRSAARRSGTSRATSAPICSGSATRRSTRRPRAGRPARATPPTSTSPARGCRTCRSAAPCGSGTSAPTGRRCCR